MHMNLPPICLARSVCCACTREENSAVEEALSATKRATATTRRLIMPFPKRYGCRQRLRGGLLPGSFRCAGQHQNCAAVRQQRNQRTEDDDQAAEPNPLHQ